jgi:hypothetical protein
MKSSLPTGQVGMTKIVTPGDDYQGEILPNKFRTGYTDKPGQVSI